MTEKHEIEIYVSMNEDGSFDVGTTEEESSERLLEEATSYTVRTIKLTIKMAAPAVEDGPTIDVPDAAGMVTQVEAA